MAAAAARPAYVPPSIFAHLSKEPRLAGKVCVISGASRGFGAAIAVRFLEEGAFVVMLSRSSCAETVALMEQVGGADKAYVAEHALWVSGDIGSEEDCNKAAAAAAAWKGGKIDVLVNNAALFVFHSVEHASAEDWDRSAAVNIKGHALLTKACLPYMKAAGGGSIVFQGSISSFLAQPNCATYSTMKGAIVQLARNCAYDFAKYGIRCNSVCAGTVETPISREERAAHGWTFEQWQALKIKDVMLGRVGHVREVANATLFFACDESSYSTAGVLMVDGGRQYRKPRRPRKKNGQLSNPIQPGVLRAAPLHPNPAQRRPARPWSSNAWKMLCTPATPPFPFPPQGSSSEQQVSAPSAFASSLVSTSTSATPALRAKSSSAARLAGNRARGGQMTTPLTKTTFAAASSGTSTKARRRPAARAARGTPDESCRKKASARPSSESATASVSGPSSETTDLRCSGAARAAPTRSPAARPRLLTCWRGNSDASGTAVTCTPGKARATASAPSAFVRLERPTKSSRPVKSTSPPSTRAGAGASTTRRPCDSSAARTAAVSARREGWPGRVTSAVPPTTTAVSSIKTLSAQPGACGTTVTAADAAAASPGARASASAEASAAT